ncbi:hypothetical protein THIOM_004214 [Candidatus Thiomargarita nelsonii]|uniref:Uncharacterized protein n=1 Tax=Candidatus Thiomargarita nelsonii TaxID=1003181 RepID=A0A176RWK1_9GAMM|nr:hypothetical protein THIOM_004214 [Candidatus Thiomargarita nelsonii]
MIHISPYIRLTFIYNDKALLFQFEQVRHSRPQRFPKPLRSLYTQHGHNLRFCHSESRQ